MQWRWSRSARDLSYGRRESGCEEATAAVRATGAVLGALASVHLSVAIAAGHGGRCSVRPSSGPLAWPSPPNAAHQVGRRVDAFYKRCKRVVSCAN